MAEMSITVARNRTVSVTIGTDSGSIGNWINMIHSKYQDSRHAVIGFNMEVNPAGHVASIHLCDDKNCLIITQEGLNSRPSSLKHFLTSDKFYLAGLDAHGMADRIMTDLRINCYRPYNTGDNLNSLREKALGVGLNVNITWNNGWDWGAATLSHDQVEYAAKVAYAAYKVAKAEI